MREPSAGYPLFGLMAEFDRPESLIEAVKRSRDAGFRRIDAYSPFPIEELAEVLDFRDRRVAWLTLFGGLFGAAAGYGMQAWLHLDYPILVGSRPTITPQAFMLITFELTVLFAVLFSIGGMLVLNHLPKLHHPVFGVESFHLATRDKFFLIVFGHDEKFDPVQTRTFLESLDPVRVDVVRQTEEPA
ncbi:DUF3341 domain-containing protein [Dongia soli]|uniref:DUF3341 domain-containing protein n=1 Tax=Dongia soli TaxID=600628 RepID=A0ABU5EDZ0_9PROT|nr:DUF3341 domain-containing protein [Dongia soli]MDY0884426.1 DUF3341 domain-containing protein [Dongia soli]